MGPAHGPYGGYATRRNQENHHSIRHPAFVTLRLVTTVSPPANPLFSLGCLGPAPPPLEGNSSLGGSEGGMHYVMHYVTICNALCNYMLGGRSGPPPQKVIVRGGGVEHPPLEV